MTATKQKWTDDRVATLEGIVGDESPVSVETVAAAAETLETTPRSVASKLRNMEYEVQSSSVAKGKTYTEAQEKEIETFLNANPSKFTYSEIASQVLDGAKTAKQIQGKILSMDLYDLVKASEKAVHIKTFTDEEESTLFKLVTTIPQPSMEKIAKVMGREENSIRGKILSMTKVHPEIKIPKKDNYVSKSEDAVTALGDLTELTVEEIANKVDKTERGIKTLLTSRGISCKNYDGAGRRAKLDAKAVETEEAA